MKIFQWKGLKLEDYITTDESYLELEKYFAQYQTKNISVPLFTFIKARCYNEWSVETYQSLSQYQYQL